MGDNEIPLRRKFLAKRECFPEIRLSLDRASEAGQAQPQGDLGAESGGLFGSQKFAKGIQRFARFALRPDIISLEKINIAELPLDRSDVEVVVPSEEFVIKRLALPKERHRLGISASV